MTLVNYACVHKSKSRHPDNYTEEINRDQSKEKTVCASCIFVGENEHITKKRLCAKHIDEIAEVQRNGTCDAGKSRFQWYNQINPIKKWLIEDTGFKFKNR